MHLLIAYLCHSVAVLETASCGACGICVCNAAWLRAGPAPHSDVAQAKAKLVREVGMCFCWWGMLLSVSLGCVMFSQLHLNTPSWQHLLITSDGSCLCSGACLHASSALKAGYRCCLQLCLDQRDTTGHSRGRSLLDHENIQGVLLHGLLPCCALLDSAVVEPSAVYFLVQAAAAGFPKVLSWTHLAALWPPCNLTRVPTGVACRLPVPQPLKIST